MTRFTTAEDAKNDIVTALGEFGADFDVDAIFAETHEYRVDENADGTELLNTAGFEQIVDADEFWVIVERHATA